MLIKSYRLNKCVFKCWRNWSWLPVRHCLRQTVPNGWGNVDQSPRGLTWWVPEGTDNDGVEHSRPTLKWQSWGLSWNVLEASGVVRMQVNYEKDARDRGNERSRSSKDIDFRSDPERVCNFQVVIIEKIDVIVTSLETTWRWSAEISNLDPILHRLRDTGHFKAENG